MKTKYYLRIAFSLFTGLCLQRANAQANTELSNLISPTRVNQSLLPMTTDSKDLGTTSASWRTIYLAGSLYLDGKRFLSNGNDSTNVFIGSNAGNKRAMAADPKTGKSNTATGQYALYSYTWGGYNTANGAEALYSNTSGVGNTATGTVALRWNTTGEFNTATGIGALYSNRGSYNTANGSYALYYNTSGNWNTANGRAALYHNTTGSENTATGYFALLSNTNGYSNTANGNYALGYNTTGFDNTANGSYALSGNTTGSYNTANGSDALFSQNTGYYNTANGYQALYRNTTGYKNTANGSNALYENTTGNYNTAIGDGAGSLNDNNARCTFIGVDADQDVITDFFNSTALGNTSRITASNQVRIGNILITSIGGYEPWTNLSDARFKKNVKENVPGLVFINQLHAITYTIDVTNLRNFLGEDRQNETTTAEGKTVREKNSEADALIQKGIQEKEKIIRTGFVAQQVEAAAKTIGYDFSGVDKPKNEHTPYGLRYSEFVVPLVKAVQELSKQNEDLQKQIDELKAIVLKGKQQSSLNVSSAALGQNVPNPFINSTIIHYTIPKSRNTGTSAKIIITDKNGKVLKEARVVGSGKGSINVDAATLSSGTYQYSLYIDGKLIDTKQMEHLK